jgi:glutamate/tyrosine decarboxylase-like PLP-dependent enzyme
MPTKNETETLDPDNWESMRALAHRAVDEGFDWLRTVRDRGVWRPTPDDVVAKFHEPLPRGPQGAESAYEDFKRWVLPYPMGNVHPRFWAWYMGNGTPLGAIGDFLAAVVNPNMGGGNHIANHVESQVVDWCKEIVGLPLTAGGLLVSGGSVANLVCLAVARNAATDSDVRAAGVRSLPASLVFYTSVEAHSCIQKALELLGIGGSALRKVAIDSEYQIDLEALDAAIRADRAVGLIPACVIGTAGTINTGAVDDLRGLASLCERHQIWFHVDGAIGAVAAIAPKAGRFLAGMERADSVALDLHKWLHVPFEAGCAIVRDRARQRAAFALTAEYLEHTARGLASGPLWFSEYGPQLSRGFRALKIWLSFKEHGLDKFGRLIDQNIAQAHELEKLIERRPDFEMMAPVKLNIACFRYRPQYLAEAHWNAFNEELLIRLHESGVAAPSYTTLERRYCLRAAISNHRTRPGDLEMMVDELAAIAARMVAGAWTPS